MSMRFIVAVVVAVILQPNVYSQAPKPQDFLAVTGIATDSVAKDFLRVGVKNVGIKTITAYRLSHVSGVGMPLSADYFPSIGLEAILNSRRSSSLTTQFGGLRPGETSDLLVSAGSAGSLDFEASAVVLADRTAVGDETQIAEIFRDRSGAVSELSRWCPSLEPARFHGRDIEEKHTIIETLVKSIRGADVQAGLTQPPGGRGERLTILDVLTHLSSKPEQDLDTVLEMLHAHCTAAPAHAERQVK